MAILRGDDGELQGLYLGTRLVLTPAVTPVRKTLSPRLRMDCIQSGVSKLDQRPRRADLVRKPAKEKTKSKNEGNGSP